MSEVLQKIQLPPVPVRGGAISSPVGVGKVNISPTTGVTTYTFPAPEVPNTNTPKLVTFRNKLTGKDVTVDRNAPINDQIEQGFGPGGTAQAFLVVAENAAKGTSTGNPKGMALILATRIAISTLKYNKGVTQYNLPTALAAGTLSQVKLSLPGYFSKFKFSNAKVQSFWHKISHASHHFHEKVDKLTYKPLLYQSKGKDLQFSYLGADFGATRIEAKYLNAKTLVWAAKGKGHSSGTHGNSESETHPQNKIENEGHRNDVNKNTHTNIIKIVTTAQTEVPDEILQYGIAYDLGIKKKKPLTPNQKKLLEVRYKRQWVIAEAINRGDTAVEIAPKVYLDLQRYTPSKEVEQAVKILQTPKGSANSKVKASGGTPPAIGPAGTAMKIAAAAYTVYETGVQLAGLASFWYNIKYGKTDAEKTALANQQNISNLQQMGGKVIKNPDGSTTVVVDPKNMNAVKKDNLGTTNLQLKFQLEKQTKEFKAAAERNKLLNFSQAEKQRGTSVFTQINTGLGINTQRGPQTGTFGQNMGWSTSKSN
jgi:hypothetical protein